MHNRTTNILTKKSNHYSCENCNIYFSTLKEDHLNLGKYEIIIFNKKGQGAYTPMNRPHKPTPITGNDSL